MKTFPNLERAVAGLSPRKRELRAEVLETSETDVIRALAQDLRFYQAIEDAHIAEFEQEVTSAQVAEYERIEKDLPPLPRWSEISEANGLESQAEEINE